MGRRTVIAVVMLIFMGLFPFAPAPAGAAQGTPDNPNPKDTHCLAQFEMTVSPGLSMTPTTGTLTSQGESGTNTCDGPINGHPVTGVGTRGEDGRYGIGAMGPTSCASSEGQGEFVFSFTMPTTAGPQRVSGTFVATYGPLQSGGLYGGTFQGERMYGRFTVTPVEGDCVTAPITKVRLQCDEWVVNET